MQCALRSFECSGTVKIINVSARERGRAKDVLRGKSPYDAPTTIRLPICEKHQSGSLYTVGWDQWDMIDNLCWLHP